MASLFCFWNYGKPLEGEPHLLELHEAAHVVIDRAVCTDNMHSDLYDELHARIMNILTGVISDRGKIHTIVLADEKNLVGRVRVSCPDRHPAFKSPKSQLR
jgi:hypothetical protein